MRASKTAIFLRVAIGTAVVSALVLGVVLASMRGRGDASVHVFAPSEEAVKVRIDDGEAVHVPEGEGFSATLAPGDHRVRLEREERAPVVHDVHVDHGQRWVVPVGEDQCFVEVDVTRSAYGRGGDARVERRRAAEPFEVSAATYLSRDELPRERSTDAAVILASPVACEAIELDDRALIAHVPHD